jgi:DNA-binding protein H-NS
LGAVYPRNLESFARCFTEFRLLAREAGFEVTLTKLGEDGSRRKSRRSAATTDADSRREVAPKYRNPDLPAEMWSGRGRKPRWLADKLAKGATVEDFLISPAATEEASAWAKAAPN